MTTIVSLHPDPSRRHCLERGFSLISAIFLLVIMSGLGVAMLTVFTTQQASSAMDVQGARAYQAARAGIEWGLYRQLQQQSCADPVSFPLPAGSTLSSFTVTVSCVLTPTFDGGANAIFTNAVPSTFKANSKTVTGLTSTVGLIPGMNVSVAGPDVNLDIRIAKIVSATSLELTVAPTAVPTVSEATYYRSPLDQWLITATACNRPVANACGAANSSDPDYVRRQLEVRL